MQVLTQDKTSILTNILNKYAAIVDADGNSIDTSQKSMVWNRSVVLAEIITMINSNLNYIINQSIPNLPFANHQTLVNFCNLYKIPFTTENDSELLELILDRIQYQPAGGNQKDWERWVKDQYYIHALNLNHIVRENVVNYLIIKDYITLGSISVIVMSNIVDFPEYDETISYDNGDLVYNPTQKKLMEFSVDQKTISNIYSYTGGIAVNKIAILSTAHGLLTNDYISISTVAHTCDGIFQVTKLDNDRFWINKTYVSDDDGTFCKFIYTMASTDLIDSIETYCEAIRPLGKPLTEYVSCIPLNQNITLVNHYTALEQETIKTALFDFVYNLKICDTLYLSDIYSIVNNLGFRNCTVTLPAVDVVTTNYEKIICQEITFV